MGTVEPKSPVNRSYENKTKLYRGYRGWVVAEEERRPDGGAVALAMGCQGETPIPGVLLPSGLIR